ncbi:MAG TPA: fructuronate reductase, partial [Erwinia persicina]|nr:fructuronate reductase [Erwinia persicina]
VAGWIRYVSGCDEQGQPVTINDPLRDELAKRVAETEEGEPRVAALLGLKNIFGDDLPGNDTFVRQVNHYYQLLLTRGAKQTVHQLVARV